MRTSVHRSIENTRHAYRRLDALPVPVYLCPTLQYTSASRNTPTRPTASTRKRSSALKQPFQRYSAIAPLENAEGESSLVHTKDGLPFSCPGCGALTQSIDPSAAGFYSKSINSSRAPAHEKNKHHANKKTHQVYESALANVGEDVLEQLGLDASSAKVTIEQDSPLRTPVCDRCHHLLHHNKGVPIDHPTMQSIRDTISESPHDHNQVYHVLDAADFPMSLIPNLHDRLSLTPQRSQNRRSKTEKYYHGRKAGLSFVITRSDLLAPKKEQVDRLMNYLVEVLRDALGSSGKDIRLGNVSCVSSKRGWWTRELKRNIRERGGGGWMVGKVNVGKSNLFECVFPKGGTNRNKIVGPQSVEHQIERTQHNDNNRFRAGSLLPPAQPETAYPVLPIISSLPGTTASPIRLPFGNGKGELIDLPGLARGNLASYISEKNQDGLVMHNRVDPKQHVIKPEQSLLLLGGLIRITPVAPKKAPDSMNNIIIIAHTFVPLPQHLTSTWKAREFQARSDSEKDPGYIHNPNFPSILKPGAGKTIRPAGRFQLKWDVTRQHTGPLTSNKRSAKIRPDLFPFKIFSTDILIEGCGWVELTAQVSKKRLQEFDQASTEGGSAEAWYPEVEVLSPTGQFIGTRKPMNAWLFAGKKKKKAKTLEKGRPRPSMKGTKKREASRKRTD
ncbi:MAG: hypothetical protein M1812_004193 [Candelaria pacifica]|nr:MAG: hypothetical protein M1812_004193 [Candelaria pacifica]